MKGTSASRASGTAQNACHSGLTMRISLNINSQSKEEVMNKLSTLPVVDNAADIVTVSGIDLAKNLFAIHGQMLPARRFRFAPRCGAINCSTCWRNCHCALSAWSPVQAHITGYERWLHLAIPQIERMKMIEKGLEEESKLRDGEVLNQLSTRGAGYMQCEDITEYEILDAKGNRIERMTLT